MAQTKPASDSWLQFFSITLAGTLLSLAIIFTLTHYYYNRAFLSAWQLYIPIAILSIIPGLFLGCSLRIFHSLRQDSVSGFGMLVLFAVFTFANLQLLNLTASHTRILPWLSPHPSEVIISHRLNLLFNPSFINAIPAYTDQTQIKRSIAAEDPETIRAIFKKALTADEFSRVTQENYSHYLTIVSQRTTETNRENISNYVTIVTNNEDNAFIYYNFIPSTLLLKLYIPLLKNTIQVFKL